MATTGIETLKSAMSTARTIIKGLAEGLANSPDAVEARRVELKAMTKDQLVELVLAGEKAPKKEGLTVQKVVESIMTAKECVCLTHDQIASIVHLALPDAKTTGKTVASIASKYGKEHGFLPREKVKIDVASLLA